MSAEPSEQPNVRDRLDGAFGSLSNALAEHASSIERLSQIDPSAAGYVAPTLVALCTAMRSLLEECQAISEQHASMSVVLGER